MDPQSPLTGSVVARINRRTEPLMSSSNARKPLSLARRSWFSKARLLLRSGFSFGWQHLLSQHWMTTPEALAR